MKAVLINTLFLCLALLTSGCENILPTSRRAGIDSIQIYKAEKLMYENNLIDNYSLVGSYMIVDSTLSNFKGDQISFSQLIERRRMTLVFYFEIGSCLSCVVNNLELIRRNPDIQKDLVFLTSFETVRQPEVEIRSHCLQCELYNSYFPGVHTQSNLLIPALRYCLLDGKGRILLTHVPNAENYKLTEFFLKQVEKIIGKA